MSPTINIVRQVIAMMNPAAILKNTLCESVYLRQSTLSASGTIRSPFLGALSL